MLAIPNDAAAQFDDDVVYASDQSDEAAPQLQSRSAASGYYGGAEPAMPDVALTDPIAADPIAACPDCNPSNGAGCQGGDCECADCCNSCWPRWYVEAEAIFLWRNNDVTVQPVVRSDITSSTVFDTRSADFDTGIGPRTLIGLRTSPYDAWECQYFSALDMTGAANITSPDLLSAAGQLGQLPGWSFVDAMGIDYKSELHNVEVNYYRNWGSLSLLGGFRFVRLSENYGLSSIDGSSSDLYDVHSENNMYGGQLGGRWRECCGQFYWEVTGKAGVFGNDANQSQFLTEQDGAQVLRDFSSYEGTVAFVGDLNVSIGFRLTKIWAARCGYNVIWIDQVALAADQLNFNVGPSAGRNISTAGDVFLHGINVGLEGRW